MNIPVVMLPIKADDPNHHFREIRRKRRTLVDSLCPAYWCDPRRRSRIPTVAMTGSICTFLLIWSDKPFPTSSLTIRALSEDKLPVPDYPPLEFNYIRDTEPDSGYAGPYRIN